MRPALLACALISTLPSVAMAYEDQVVATIDVGYAAALANDDLPTHAFQFGVGANVGLGDAWALHTRLSYGYHPSRNNDPLHVTMVGLEVVYLLDILEVVPFFGLGVDGIGTISGGEFGADFGVHAILGVDWLLARRWLIGFEVRPYLLPFSLADTGVDPVYLAVNVRAGVIFDRY